MEQKTQSNIKKVVYLITKSNFGGAQKYVYELSLGAQKNGYEVTVLLGGEGLLSKKLNEAGIKTYSIKNLQRDINISSEIKSLIEITKILKKIRPDILHVNSSKAGAIGTLAGRICGIKNIIFTIHGWAFNEDRDILSKVFIKITYLFTILLSHSSIAVSEHTKKQSENIPFSFLIKNKIEVIYNGVREINFLERNYVRDFFKEKFNISHEDFLVGTLAELHPIKGLKFLVKAATNINQEKIKILILGTGQDEQTLNKQIKENNLENKVILGGYLENGSSFLKGFDTFILPSLSEAMPLSIIEAGLAETPVIATSVGGISEIIENEKDGLLIEPKNEKQITEKISWLINDQNYSKQLASSLKNKIHENFNVEKFYKETFNLYKNSNYKNTRKGFTLLELLVVISMIGFLSSVVTASLNVARENAKIKSGMKSEATLAHRYPSNANISFENGQIKDLTGRNFSNGSANVNYSNDVPYGDKQSIDFNGNSGYVSFPKNNSVNDIQTNGGFMISAWIKYPPASFGRVLTSGHHGFDGGFLLGTTKEAMTNQKYEVIVGVGGDSTIYNDDSQEKPNSTFFYTIGANINDGKWHHIAFVTDYQNKQSMIYVDGKEMPIAKYPGTCGVIEGTKLNITNCNTKPIPDTRYNDWYIGKAPVTNSEYFTGKIFNPIIGVDN